MQTFGDRTHGAGGKRDGEESEEASVLKTKAVKANARASVGTPPASRVLPAQKPAPGRKQKHKPTLERLLKAAE